MLSSEFMSFRNLWLEKIDIYINNSTEDIFDNFWGILLAMGKMRILELVDDARVLNTDLIYQAKELGFYVQAYFANKIFFILLASLRKPKKG